MAKIIHNGMRKAVKAAAQKAGADRSASVMKPECLALIENFRLMDDTFMSKCLENAPARTLAGCVIRMSFSLPRTT